MTYADELGGMVNPEQGGGFTELLADPIKRSALLSFGLQAMTGGWGNGTQQLGAALGAGAQGAGQTAESMQKQGEADRAHSFRERGLAQTASEGDKNRASHEKIAETGAASREAVAELRGKYSIERGMLALQKAPANLSVKYLAEARRIVEGNLTNLSMDDRTKTDLVKSKAAELYQSDMERGLVPQTTGGGDVNSQNSPGTGGTAGKGAGAPDDENALAAVPGLTLDKLLTHHKAGVRATEDMKTPEGQQRLMKKFPQLQREIIDRNAKQGVYPEHFGYGR